MTWLYLRECEESFLALEKRPTYAVPEFRDGFEYGWRAACRFLQGADASKLAALIREGQGHMITMALSAKLDALDAARYRWARLHGAWDTEMFLNSLTPEQYDAELDKRMAEDNTQR